MISSFWAPTCLNSCESSEIVTKANSFVSLLKSILSIITDTVD